MSRSASSAKGPPGPSRRPERFPRASVIVPTYDRPAALERCLAALVRLEPPAGRFEIIVVDDGSPRPVRLPPLPDEPRVALVRQPNRGPAAARNHGARVARGEILAFTDDDCRPRPDWLRRISASLEEPDLLVGGVTENALNHRIWSQASQELVSFLYGAFDSARRMRPFFTSNNLGVRRAAFLDLGGFDESFRFSAAEDRDLSERWALSGGRLRLVPEARVDHYHALDLRSFARQHHRYGRGATHLARCRGARGQSTPLPEPLSFYARMLAFPFRRHPPGSALTISMAIALAQLCGLGGMAAEFLRPTFRGPALEARPTGDVSTGIR